MDLDKYILGNDSPLTPGLGPAAVPLPYGHIAASDIIRRLHPGVEPLSTVLDLESKFDVLGFKSLRNILGRQRRELEVPLRREPATGQRRYHSLQLSPCRYYRNTHNSTRFRLLSHLNLKSLFSASGLLYRIPHIETWKIPSI
jgi:hypothetical protein